MPIHVCPPNCFHPKPRDLDILRLVADGCDNREIAERLGFSPYTVRNRMTYLLATFGARTRAQMVMRAMKTGAFDPFDDQPQEAH